MAVSNSTSSLPTPMPRSPPKYPDLCGKHRKQVELQRMTREIGFLEEELRSVDGIQSASRYCKEVVDFVGSNPDPLIPVNQKVHRSFRIWKWLRAIFCCNLSCICCRSGCSLHLRRPRCCSCDCTRNWRCCCEPRCPRCRCCCCFKKLSCSSCCALPTLSCCVFPALSCPDCSCSCVCSCPKCPKVCCSCPKCAGNCCLSCYNCLSNCFYC